MPNLPNQGYSMEDLLGGLDVEEELDQLVKLNLEQPEEVDFLQDAVKNHVPSNSPRVHKKKEDPMEYLLTSIKAMTNASEKKSEKTSILNTFVTYLHAFIKKMDSFFKQINSNKISSIQAKKKLIEEEKNNLKEKKEELKVLQSEVVEKTQEVLSNSKKIKTDLSELKSVFNEQKELGKQRMRLEKVMHSPRINNLPSKQKQRAIDNLTERLVATKQKYEECTLRLKHMPSEMETTLKKTEASLDRFEKAKKMCEVTDKVLEKVHNKVNTETKRVEQACMKKEMNEVRAGRQTSQIGTIDKKNSDEKNRVFPGLGK